MPDLIPVRFRDCSCPGTPHPDGDVAELRPYLDFAGGAEALAAVTVVDEDGTTSHFRPVEEWAQYIGPVYIRRGVADWNVVDEDGDPVPVTREALEALRYEEAYELANRADDLYGGQVLAPLVKRANALSKAGRTNGSTPRPRPSSRKPRKPSPSSS
jgi:hypothetical protein